MRRTVCCVMPLAVYTLGIACALTIPSLSQDWTPSGGEGPPPKVADVLTQHHIALTKDALIAALHNDSAEIRGLAATQLADEGAKDAIPAIAEALEAEQVPAQKIYIAKALAYMGDQRGLQALRSDCEGTSLTMADRLTAVEYLVFDHQDESCWRTVLEAAQSRDSYEDRLQAMTLIPSFKRLAAQQPTMFHEVILNGLRDDNTSVRIEASNALRVIGDTSAIPALEAAIVAETSPDVRSMLESNLKYLQKKQQ